MLPDGNATTPRRNTTTTATQALLLINGDWALARAKALAARLERLEPALDRRPGPDRPGLPLGLRAATRARRNRGSRWRFIDRQAKPSSRHPPSDRTPRPTMRRSSISAMCS